MLIPLFAILFLLFLTEVLTAIKRFSVKNTAVRASVKHHQSGATRWFGILMGIFPLLFRQNHWLFAQRLYNKVGNKSSPRVVKDMVLYDARFYFTVVVVLFIKICFLCCRNHDTVNTRNRLKSSCNYNRMIRFPLLAKNTPIFLTEYIIAHTY